MGRKKHLCYSSKEKILFAGDIALNYMARRDIAEEEVEDVSLLWELPDVTALLKKQLPSGAWKYPGRVSKSMQSANYNLYETFKHVALLVGKYGMTNAHPALARAAEYIFSCQTEEGDIRGVIGNQYASYYTGATLFHLIAAGYEDDPRTHAALQWLLACRQDDGGWASPIRTANISYADLDDRMPVAPMKERRSSHLFTGMALRPLAAHPAYRSRDEVTRACDFLKSRFFNADVHSDRRNASYWTKFTFPFFWTDILSSLHTLADAGYTKDDKDVSRALAWFRKEQHENGLWTTGYENAKDKMLGNWVAYAIVLVFKRFFGEVSW